MKIIRRSLMTLFIIFFSLFAVAYYFLATTSGSRFTLHLLMKYIPGKLIIASNSGTLWHHFSLQGVDYQNTQIYIHINQLTLNWRAQQLLLGKIDVLQLQAQHIIIISQVPPIAQQSSSISNFNLLQLKNWLQRVHVSHAELSDVIFQHSKKNIIITQLNFDYQPHQLSQLNIKSPGGNGVFQYLISVDKAFKWQLNGMIQQLNLQFYLPQYQSQINLNFLSMGQWGKNNQQATLSIEQLNGYWQHLPLIGKGKLNYDNGNINIQPTELAIGAAYFKIEGYLEQQWAFQWQLNIPDMSKLLSESSGTIISAGTVLGEVNQPRIAANLAVNNFKWQDIHLKLLQSQLSIPLNTEMPMHFNIAFSNLQYQQYILPAINLQGQGQLKSQQFLIYSQLLIDAKNHGQFNFVLPKFSGWHNLQQPIQGEGNLYFASLKKLLKISPQNLPPLDGTLTSEIKLFGTLSHPQWKITTALKNGDLQINQIGLKIHQINLLSNYNETQLLQLQGTFIAGSGHGQIDGKIDLASMPIKAAIHLRGNQLDIIQSKEYQVRATPDLQLSYEQNHLNINGTINIPYAQLTPTNFTSVVQLPVEVVYSNQPAKTAATEMPLNLQLHIQFVLGDKIHISYDNLNTDLQGQLLISQMPGNSPTAAGELKTTKGQYHAYGQLLTIKTGRLIYAGNLLNDPGLDILAVKIINTIGFGGSTQFTGDTQFQTANNNQVVVGVAIKGSLNHPLLTLYSDPAGLSQNDILSYLIFGRPQSQVSKNDNLALLSIASSMYGPGDMQGNFTQKLQNTLGLSEINIGTTQVFNPDTQTSTAEQTITLGKQLSNNLFLNYSMGLFSTVQILTLRYQINHYLALRTQASSIETGADILFEYE